MHTFTPRKLARATTLGGLSPQSGQTFSSTSLGSTFLLVGRQAETEFSHRGFVQGGRKAYTTVDSCLRDRCLTTGDRVA